MAAAFTKLKATPNRLTYLVVGDGTSPSTRTSALLLADMVAGPLKRAWNATYATQALMRSALSQGVTKVQGGYGRIHHSTRLAPAATTAKIAGVSVDVDVDAVTATKAELNVQCFDDAAGTDEYIVDLEFLPAAIG